MQERKNCKCCGKEFLTARKHQIYCCKSCAQKAGNEKNRERKIKEREQRQSKKKKKDNLIEINEAARAAGMTYGRYVAMQYAKTITIGGNDESKM